MLDASHLGCVLVGADERLLHDGLTEHLRDFMWGIPWKEETSVPSLHVIDHRSVEYIVMLMNYEYVSLVIPEKTSQS